MEAINKLLNQPLDPAWVLGISVPLLIFFLWLAYRQQQPYHSKARDYVSLQQLIDDFSKAGIELQADIEADDLQLTLPVNPELLLMAYGGIVFKDKQWVSVSQQVIHFDYECIEDELDSYLDIFDGFVSLIPSTESISHNACIQGQTLEYQIGHIKRTLKPKIDNDWADEAVIKQLIKDVAQQLPQGYQIRSHDDGQAVVFVVITNEQYSKLYEKTQIKLSPL